MPKTYSDTDSALAAEAVLTGHARRLIDCAPEVFAAALEAAMSSCKVPLTSELELTATVTIAPAIPVPPNQRDQIRRSIHRHS